MAVARDELLAASSNISVLWCFQGGVSCIATAYELVQTKGKYGETSLWVEDTVSRQEPSLNAQLALFFGNARNPGQPMGGSLGANNGDRGGAAQSACPLLRCQSKGGLNPDGQRVSDKASVVFWWFPLGIADPFSQCLHKYRILGIPLRRRSL